MNWNKLLSLCQSAPSTFGAFIAEHSQNLSYGNLVEYLNPALFIIVANKEDNPTYAKAMQGPDSAGFIAAMEAKIAILKEMNVFDIVQRTADMDVLSGVWALKTK